MTAVSFTPLKSSSSTRLLVLHPGSRDDMMECSLVEVDIEDEPEYDAVSYTWGDLARQQIIQVNGSLVQIRYNLYTCLREIRDTAHDRSLWIDALSISQTDLDEKSSQVAMIGRIFKQASCVRAWLGEHADNSEVLFRTEPDSLESAGPVWNKSDVLRRRLCHRPIGLGLIFGTLLGVFFGLSIGLLFGPWLGGAIGLGIGVSWTISGGGILMATRMSTREVSYRRIEWRRFVRRPYWTKTWIVQEIALATAFFVHCGAGCMDWEGLVESRLGYHDSSSDVLFDGTGIVDQLNRSDDDHIAFLNMLRQAPMSRRQWSIAYLSRWVRDTECEDQRDRIYALLSMEKQKPRQEEILPNYRMGVPELFVEILNKRFLDVAQWHRDNSAITELLLGLRIGGLQQLGILQVVKNDRERYSALKDLMFGGRGGLGGTTEYWGLKVSHGPSQIGMIF